MHRILVIDDDSRIHTLVKAHFGEDGFEIISADNGTDALSAAESQQPDIILLDVDLRETQGFEVCRRLKANTLTRSIPVIFLTSNSNVEAKVFGLECGGIDYLLKPFHPSELRARIHVALRTKSQLAQSVQH